MMDAQRQPADQQQHIHNKVSLSSFHHTVIRPLTENRDPCIKPDTLKKLQISVAPLSFTTGQLPLGVDTFFEPIAPTIVENWLTRSKPWTVEGKDFGIPDYDDEPFHSNGQVDARFFWYKIKEYLTLSHDRNAPCLIPDHTNWRLHRNIIKNLNCLSKGQANWQVQVLQSFSLGGDRWAPDDITKPHVICFLADEVPPQENVVLTSELTTISILAYRTAIEPGYSKHSFIPVMVVTASTRDVRIVQGVFDVKQGRLELRMSKTVNFKKGIVANWNEFLTLLGWVVAKPIGNTL